MVKPLYVAGNWKSNKTTSEAKNWIEMYQKLQRPAAKNTTVLLCVPFTLLPFLHWKIGELQLPIVLGAQDVSPFENGAYTGAVAASQIAEFAKWVMIGHSERRSNFHEDDDMLAKKVTQALQNNLSVLYCVSDEKMPIPKGVQAVAYEPIWAIGSGKSDDPAHAESVCEKIKQRFNGSVLYGGSVNPENVASFANQPSIDGVLPGAASLDAEKFTRIISALYLQ